MKLHCFPDTIYLLYCTSFLNLDLPRRIVPHQRTRSFSFSRERHSASEEMTVSNTSRCELELGIGSIYVTACRLCSYRSGRIYSENGGNSGRSVVVRYRAKSRGIRAKLEVDADLEHYFLCKDATVHVYYVEKTRLEKK